MSNKHINRCPTLVIQKLQIQNIDGFSSALNWYKTLTRSNVGEDVEQRKLLHIADEWVTWYNWLGKSFDIIQ